MQFSANSVRALSLAGALMLAPVATYAAVVLESPVELYVSATGPFLNLQLESAGNVFIDLEDFEGFAFTSLTLGAGESISIGNFDGTVPWPYGSGDFTVAPVSDGALLDFSGGDVLLRPDALWAGGRLEVRAGQDLRIYGGPVASDEVILLANGGAGSDTGGDGSSDGGSVIIHGGMDPASSVVLSGGVLTVGSGLSGFPGPTVVSGGITVGTVGGVTIISDADPEPVLVTLPPGDLVLVATPLPGAIWLMLPALVFLGTSMRRQLP